MISISKYQYANCGHMVTVIHQGTGSDDIKEIVANTQEEAIRILLEARGLKDISDLKPQTIETKWC